MGPNFTNKREIKVFIYKTFYRKIQTAATVVRYLFDFIMKIYKKIHYQNIIKLVLKNIIQCMTTLTMGTPIMELLL